ncbi:MAG: hypothetical protein RQ756_07860, partial [Flavobacteriaceae bacterium]|nr:hypothetical protein [Flavobacteriaceae bacterium]
MILARTWIQKSAAVIVLLSILGCGNTSTTSSDIDYLIPEQSTLVVKSNNYKSLNEQLTSNKNLQKFLETAARKDFEKSLAFTEYLNTDQPIVLASSKLGKADYAQVLITTASNDSIKNTTVESIVYEGEVIQKYITSNFDFFQVRLNAYDYWSNDLLSLEDLIRIYHSDEAIQNSAFQRLFSSAKPNGQHLFIKTPTASPFNTLIPEIVSTSPFFKTEGWFHLTLDLQASAAKSQGVFMPNTTGLNQEGNSFPVSQNLNFPYFHLLNFNTVDVFSLGNNNFEDALLMAQNEQATEVLSGFSKAIRADQSKALLLECVDPEVCKNFLTIEPQSPEQDYRGISIFKTDDTAQKISKPFGSNFNYYFFLHQYLIYVQNLEAAENIILNLQDVDTEENPGNIITVEAPTQSHKARFIQQGKSMGGDLLAEFVLKEKNFYHYYLALAPEQKMDSDQSGYTAISVSHTNDFITEPQFFNNWRTKAQEILIQDSEYRLYKYSLSGELIWSKQLDAAIIGTIHEVDMYKNGRIQALFNTANKLYILDKDGNEVAPFPMNFKDKLTQPVALFDYDKNKNYRLLTTQGNKVQMLDIQGKVVKGFRFKNTKSTIAQPPT